MRRVVRALAPLVVSVGVAAGALVLLPGPATTDELLAEQYGGPGDRVAEAVAGMRDDHVHVTEDGRPMLSAADEAAVSEAVTARDLPVYVTVWRPSWFAGYAHPIQAAEQMAYALGEETGEPVLVVLWQGPDDGYLEATPGHTWSPRGASYEQERPQFLGEAGTRLVEWVEGLPDEAAGAPAFEARPGEPAAAGVATGVLAGLGVTAGVALVVVPSRMVLRRRAPRARRGKPGATGVQAR